MSAVTTGEGVGEAARGGARRVAWLPLPGPGGLRHQGPWMSPLALAAVLALWLAGTTGRCFRHGGGPSLPYSPDFYREAWPETTGPSSLADRGRIAASRALTRRLLQVSEDEARERDQRRAV